MALVLLQHSISKFIQEEYEAEKVTYGHKLVVRPRPNRRSLCSVWSRDHPVYTLFCTKTRTLSYRKAGFYAVSANTGFLRSVALTMPDKCP